MATFGEMQTSVSKRLLDPSNTSVSASDVALALNDAIKYWKFRRFWFNEVFDSATLTTQDGTIPLSSDFLVPSTQGDGFVIEYSNLRYPLEKLTQQEYDAMYLSNGYGLPRWYARVGTDYEVYPLPDRDYTIKRHYLKDYKVIAQENYNAKNDFTDYADRLLILWSCANLIAEFRQDEKMESYFRSAATDEFNNLQVMTRKSNSSGSLTQSSVLLS